MATSQDFPTWTCGLRQLDEVRCVLEYQIALLEEHRQALITHAVTYGIDGLPGVA